MQRTAAATPALRAPFHATVSTEHSSITLWLPRDFQGPVSIYTRHGAIKVSAAFMERVTLCHEADHTRRLFVGDMTAVSEGSVGRGDEVTVRTEQGRVRVRFVDEEDEEGGKGKGLLARVFGR